LERSGKVWKELKKDKNEYKSSLGGRRQKPIGVLNSPEKTCKLRSTIRFFSVKQTFLTQIFVFVFVIVLCFVSVLSLFCLCFFLDIDEEKKLSMFKYSGYNKPWPKLCSA
jgi:hypothetical protein